MRHHPEKKKRWNLFAREIEDLLRKRGRDLGDLISEAGLHSEKVRRLKHSLALPKFHLLSPEDLEQVTITFGFTGEEQLRLRAALLATAVEEMLMNRIDADNALRAAEEIFPLLLKALRDRLRQQRGLAATRRSIETEETTLTDRLDPFLERFDQAVLALHLSRQSETLVAKREHITKAYTGFLEALRDVEALGTTDPLMAGTEVWQLWHQEAQKGLTAAQEALRDLRP